MNIEVELRNLRAADEARPLPSSGAIWWRAEIDRARRSRARASRPFAFLQAVSAVAGVAGALSLWSENGVDWMAAPLAVLAGVLVWKLYSFDIPTCKP